MLDILQNMVNELNTTNSTNDKIEILKKYPQCKELLKYVYSPFIQFGVTSEQLSKRQDLCEEVDFDSSSIVELLDLLKDEMITGNKAVSVVNGFIKKYGYQDLIYNIIDKNLKTRTDSSTINKAFPKLIPTFDVALAYNYEDHKTKVKWEDGWYCSCKIDGVRTIIIKKGDDVKALS